MTPSSSLPSPRRERWQPLRSGLLNLYRFDREELWWEEGRLLLRGNNGTGKSRVLALQLPFLLDGEVSPHRLEPDGDPAKRVEWNLLLGKHEERLGYTWVELGRRDGDGERFLTLGCGLSAVAGRKLDRWFFLTPKRIGRDLFLQTRAGQALSRHRLEEALGGEGSVHTTVATWRRAVDEALFHLGERRYEALMNLLIQLRQPQLSRKLDEEKLSQALSDALPPLPEAVLGDVAESFRALEEERETLTHLAAAHRGVETFLTEYRLYAAVAARRRAEAVRATHSAYEAAQRRLRSAESRREEAEGDAARFEEEIHRLGVQVRGAESRVETLAQSPEMRQAAALDAARRGAAERRREAAVVEEEHSRAVETRHARQAQAEQDAAAAGELRQRLADALEAAGERAGAAGLEAEHRAASEALEGLEPVEAPEAPGEEPPPFEPVRRRLGEAVAQRRQAARRLRELGRAVTAADGELAAAKEMQADLAGQVDGALDRQRLAHADLESAAGELASAWRRWAEGLEELAPADPEEVAEAILEWAESGEGESPAAEAARPAAAAAARRLAAERARLEDQRRAVETELAEIAGERERLESGWHPPPPWVPSRDAAGREGRPGAAFWRLVDFTPELPEAHRAGVEAALEAAGLLDAWVTPEGRLLAGGEHDAVLVAGDEPPLPRDGSLAAVLRPAGDPGGEEGDPEVPATTVEAVLARVGLGPGSGPVWVAADGRYRLGPLHGAWAKPAPQHLGPEARAAERRRRLETLGELHDDARRRAEELDRALFALAGREERAHREAAAVPGDEAVRRARAAIAAAAEAIAELRGRLAAAERRVVERRTRRDEAAQRRQRDARDLRVERWIDDPGALEDAVTAYQESLAALWPTLDAHRRARRQAAGAAARAEEARAEERRRGARLTEAEARAAATAAEAETLEQTVGAAVEEVVARLERARSELEDLRQKRETAREARSEARTRSAVAVREIELEQENLERETRERESAVEGLARFTATGLSPLVAPDLETGDPRAWSVTRAVEVARGLEALLGEVASGDEVWRRRQREIHQHVQTLFDALLPHGWQPLRTQEDDLLVVTVPFQGRFAGMAELAAALAEEIAERRTLLTAREREVLENHLMREMAEQLHHLLRGAEEWVEEMNRELDARPMSTGLKLRFVWHPAGDAPPGLAEARHQLLRMSEMWSPAEREALGAFLQRRIEEARADDEQGSWQEHLATALDYRKWHRFAVERHQDGVWKRLTRRTHGTGSGGEKAVALTVPQLAAAAAHYRSADPRSPRLILLDEAFVGVDADMRSKCMGLLGVFDLDFVMTSEREWGCYPTVPGLAIYQLAARPGIDAVGVTRWVWNGRERRRDEAPVPPAAPPERRREAPAGGLFGEAEAGEGETGA